MVETVLPRLTRKGYLDTEKIRVVRVDPVEDTLHGHEFFELVYVMRGSALHRLGTQATRVSEGDYFIVDFGSFHCYNENRGFTIVNCLFAPEYVDRALVNCPSLSALLANGVRRFDVPQSGVRFADRVYRDSDGRIRALIESMEREFSEKQPGYIEMLRCRLIEVLVHTTRGTELPGPEESVHPAAAAMTEYLRENYREPLSLDALSAKLGYTPQYLSCLFHRELNVSLSTFLQKLRVEKSCLLLAETRMSVALVAQEVGYGDSRHFNAVFRRHMGMSPREFRRRAVSAE